MIFKKEKATENSTSWDHQEMQKHTHSIIAENLHIVGDIRFAGTLRVDGRVDGKIELIKKQTGTLILSTTAQINGPVSTTNLVSNGVINGRVYVDEKLECRNNSRINGHVQYGSLDLDSGAIIEGRCTKKPEKAGKSSSPKKSLETAMGSFLKTR
tara:strand:+ start:1941 stop:2405 length:465 start_codon:yes stop_codon:yes gene_type:complete